MVHLELELNLDGIECFNYDRDLLSWKKKKELKDFLE